jgi:hypothetical protein
MDQGTKEQWINGSSNESNNGVTKSNNRSSNKSNNGVTKSNNGSSNEK